MPDGSRAAVDIGHVLKWVISIGFAASLTYPLFGAADAFRISSDVAHVLELEM
jgi:hypothetical protein